MPTHALADVTLEAACGTDLWRKPPGTDIDSVPHRALPLVKLSRLESVRATFSGAWRRQYDQGGVLLRLKREGRGVDNEESTNDSWIKMGVELYNGVPRVSFVGCDRFADWSVHPLRAPPTGPVTVELRREGDDNGTALWAYELVVDADGKVLERLPVRECTWPWHHPFGTTLEVAAYCARPAKPDPSRDGGEAQTLRVHFDSLVLETSD